MTEEDINKAVDELINKTAEWLTDNGEKLLKKLRRIDWREYEKV